MKDHSTLPKNPGVYIFKDVNNEIIYIGKAKNLKSRVASYFKNSSDLSTKTRHLVGKIHDVEYFIVDNEVEALLLENQMIKKHKPKYNIMLKDSKTFAYILITDEEFPRILTTRRVGRKGNYFGPFTEGSARLDLIKLAVSLFRIRTCNKMPKKPCLNYFIGTCTAPCSAQVSKEHYQKQVEDAISFLNGNTEPVVEKLKLEMKSASKELNFETALKIRKQIESIVHLHQKQKIERILRFNQDVVAMKPLNGTAIIVVFSISKGIISGKKEFNLEFEKEVLENFVKLYYSKVEIPEEIIVSQEFWNNDGEKNILEAYLSRLKGKRAVLTFPRRGEKLALVEMAIKNIAISSNPIALKEIKEKLNLPANPAIIECLDVSNLSYEHVVGAMVRFVNANPEPSGYRRFEIKSFAGADDYAAIHEIVFRRYSRIVAEKSTLPDLIIIDGGPGQLSSALLALKSIGLTVPIIALAKQNEEIYFPGMQIPIRVPINSPMMLLIRQVRDTAHRFALSYNRKKRQMKMREGKTLFNRNPTS